MKIEILTTPDCSNCAILEKMLDQMDISYQVIDVTEKPIISQNIQFLPLLAL